MQRSELAFIKRLALGVRVRVVRVRVRRGVRVGLGWVGLGWATQNIHPTVVVTLKSPENATNRGKRPNVGGNVCGNSVSVSLSHSNVVVVQFGFASLPFLLRSKRNLFLFLFAILLFHTHRLVPAKSPGLFMGPESYGNETGRDGTGQDGTRSGPVPLLHEERD